MFKQIKNIFVYNGFEPERLYKVRKEIVDVTVEGFKKLSMGVGMLYILAFFMESGVNYRKVDIAYLICYSLFMLLIRGFQKTKNYKIAEFAISYLMVAILGIALVESTYFCLDSRGTFFPIYLILFAVTFTGNPFAFDMIAVVMVSAFFIVCYNLKSFDYFQEDAYTVAFAWLMSNLLNAMTSRSRIRVILKTHEVEDNRQKYKTVYDTAPCGIVEYKIKDNNLEIVQINRQGLDLYGYTWEEIKAYSGNIISERVHYEDVKKIETQISHLSKVGDSFRYEYRLMRKDETYVWVIGQSYVTGVDESEINVLSACIDIDAQKKAIDANEAKSKFLSRMSHDIRTPMNAIIGLTDIVLDSPELSEDVKQKMDDIKSSSKFLLGLINDILDVSKIEADEMILHPEPYQNKEFINYLHTMMDPLCSQKNITLKIEDSAKKYDYILIDKVRFNQIFFNLLSNAVKFTPNGGEIYVGIEHILKDGKEAEKITISDNGIGMSEEFLDRMFDPFSQEDTEHINESQGTGLGLAIVKRIVDLMGGTIEVESSLGKGTTYTIELEINPCEAPNEKHDDGDYSVLDGKTILLCEDHPINQQIAVALLSKVGINVEVAGNGQEGLKIFNDSQMGHFDAILMDIRMPIMGGLEATQKIRKLDREDAKEISIIAMTANVFDTDRKKSIDAGMNDHIAKPIEPQILYSTLKKYII